MKKYWKRILLLPLVFMILFLSACSSKVQESDVSTEEQTIDLGTATDENHNEQADRKSYLDKILNLPEQDFKGASFRIATDDNSLFAPQNSESYVGKEIYLRNKAVEEKYNVKIVLTDESGTAAIADRLKAEALAGSGFCDLIVLKSNQFQALVTENLLQNIRNVPYLQLNCDGMHPDSVSATTLGSVSYGFSGDFTYQAEHAYAVFFNKSLLDSTGLPDLYDLVKQNQWDYDNFLLYAEEVYSQARASGNKVFGFISTESREGLINVFWAASGQRFLQNAYGERPYLQYQNETTDEFISKLQKLLFRTVAYSENTGNAVNEFASGNSVFLIAPLSAIDEVKSDGVRFGIVPLPKQDINQADFYSYTKPDYRIAGFINGTPDPVMSGLVSTALVKASAGLNQHLCEITYLNLHFNSEKDNEMLKMIMDTPYYDPIEFFGQIDPSFPAATQTLLYRVISSDGRFATLFSQYSKMLDKYLDENL